MLKSALTDGPRGSLPINGAGFEMVAQRYRREYLRDGFGRLATTAIVNNRRTAMRWVALLMALACIPSVCAPTAQRIVAAHGGRAA